jgi:RNA polymerase sigma-70 factor (ECF subfamily)
MEETGVLLMSDEEIVRTYSDMIFGVAMRYVRNPTDAEDVYSEVFYRYYRRVREFQSEEHRKAWLMRVTINCSKEFLMNRQFHEELNEDMFGSVTLTGTSEASLEDILAVREALKKLSEEYREVIELFYFSQLTIPEIAQMLQRPAGTVKSQLSRAREKLRELLS